MFGSVLTFLVLAVGGAVGSLLFLCVIWSLLSKRRQRRAALEIEPPDCGKLLRPPGHWLQERLFELAEKQNDQVMSATMCAVFAGLVGTGSLTILLRTLSNPQFLHNSLMECQIVGAGFGLLLAALCSVRAWQGANEVLELRADAERKRLGLRGEQAVAEALHSPEVAGKGYFTFHDVPSDVGGNIDHVVIGPGGVFVVETKTRSQQRPAEGKKRNRLEFDGKTTTFPTGKWDANASAQVQRNAERVQSWLQRAVASATVEPLLVFPGWEVFLTRRSELKAMSSRSFRFHFKDLPPRFSDPELAAMRAVLDKRTRSISL